MVIYLLTHWFGDLEVMGVFGSFPAADTALRKDYELGDAKWKQNPKVMSVWTIKPNDYEHFSIRAMKVIE